jgi:hypothetical protein
VPGRRKQAGELASDAGSVLYEQDAGHGRLRPTPRPDAGWTSAGGLVDGALSADPVGCGLRSDRRAAASPRACRVRGRRPAEREKQGTPVSGGPPGGRVEYPCPCPPCRSVRPVHRSDPAFLSPPEPGPPCHWMPQQACHATRLGSGALGPEHDHAVAGGQVDLGAGVGERFPLARRMAGSSRTDQPKARLATASEDCSETAMGTTGPTMRRTPLRTSQGLPQLHKLPRRPNSKVTASG